MHEMNTILTSWRSQLGDLNWRSALKGVSAEVDRATASIDNHDVRSGLWHTMSCGTHERLNDDVPR